jgi:hypothetical protein
MTHIKNITNSSKIFLILPQLIIFIVYERLNLIQRHQNNPKWNEIAESQKRFYRKSRTILVK